MRTAAVAKLKASLSEYLRHVKAGEEVLVTERGHPIARLLPAVTSGWPAHLREMEAQGLIKMGSGELPRAFWRLPRPKDPKGRVMRALLQERTDGR
ncbi:MAG: type II toxin-antitoxin system prevent-host-death family antitoxin [Chloroflexota bacterium]|nr:type II toxin-antitoxin system prevent-host-death family antitoxin [Chloroflexota bacterium]